MYFYDEDHEPMEVSGKIYIGSQFAIASLPNRSGQNIVGLFSEDDDNYFLTATFSSCWLPDLINVATEFSK